jgi:hypothetical protein
MAVTDDVRREILAVFAGRRVVCLGGVLAGMTPIVAELRLAGVERMLLVATSLGTGELPEGDDVDVIVDEVELQPTATGTFRAEERWAAAPPEALVTAVRTFGGEDTLVLAQAFSNIRHFGPYPVFGPRRAEWVALEDKTADDELFAACSVDRPPSEVVASTTQALTAAHERQDTGAGTVWAGDAREGFNGGAEYVRWVRDDHSRETAVEFFIPRCDRVRVAQFVDGVPCSIHGFVTVDDAMVLRPVELMTMRVDDPEGLRYCGAATYFDPPAEYRDAMRAAASRVGAFLRHKIGFRGGFTLDGICGEGGWVATECNPRGGAGLGYLPACTPELMSGLMQRVVVEGGLRSIPARALEELVVSRADATRWGGAWVAGATPWETTTSTGIVGDALGYRRARDGEAVDATLTTGPGRGFGFVRFEPVRGRTPVGPSLAPRAAAAFAFADRELDTAIGALRPAADVCQRS